MIKQTIKYTDYNDVEHVEDHYFHIAKNEIVEMHLVSNNTLVDELTAIGNSNDGAQIIPKFKEIIRLGYGKRSEDGVRFDKDPKHFEAFSQTGAYDEFMVSLYTNADFAARFVNGLFPPDIVAAATKEAERIRSRPAPQDRLPKQTGAVNLPQETTKVAFPDPVETTPTPVPGTDIWSQIPQEERDRILAQHAQHMDQAYQQEGSSGVSLPEADSSGYLQRPPHESGSSTQQ